MPAVARPQPANRRLVQARLREKFAVVRGLLRGEGVHQARVRRAIGAVVIELEDAALYGAGAVKKLAEEFNLDPATLYDYAKVARLWTEAEFENLLEMRRTDHDLSFSHFVEVAKVQCPVQRGVWLEKAVRDRLSVAKLKEAIIKAVPSARPAGAVTCSRKRVLPSPDRFDGALRKAADVLAIILATLQSSTATSSDDSNIRAEHARTLAGFQRLTNDYAQLAKQVRAILAKVGAGGRSAKSDRVYLLPFYPSEDQVEQAHDSRDAN